MVVETLLLLLIAFVVFCLVRMSELARKVDSLNNQVLHSSILVQNAIEDLGTKVDLANEMTLVRVQKEMAPAIAALSGTQYRDEAS